MRFFGLTTNKEVDTITKGIVDSYEERISEINGSAFYPTNAYSSYFDNLSDDKIIKLYNHCAPIFACIDLLSRANSNKVYKIKDVETGKEVPQEESNKVLDKIRSLTSKPNPLQSSSEYERYAAAYYFLNGNSYDMGNINVPYKGSSILDIQSMSLLPSQHVEINGKDDYFYETELDEIIHSYTLSSTTTGKRYEFSPYAVNHMNEPNLLWEGIDKPQRDVQSLKGIPRIKRLQWEVKNQEIANDTLNNTLNNGGMSGMFSPNLKDSDGSIPLNSTQKDTVQAEMLKYGNKNGQRRFGVFDVPMSFSNTTVTPVELGIFEVINKNWIACATIFGVPKLLLAQYIAGATFENQLQSNKELYTNTIIPYSRDRDNSLNDFFKLRELGYYIESSFDHLPFMQDDKRNASIANKNQGSTYKELFFGGNCTYDEWRNSVGLDNDSDTTLGESKIFDLDSSQLSTIGVGMNVSKE